MKQMTEENRIKQEEQATILKEVLKALKETGKGRDGVKRIKQRKQEQIRGAKRRRTRGAITQKEVRGEGQRGWVRKEQKEEQKRKAE